MKKYLLFVILMFMIGTIYVSAEEGIKYKFGQVVQYNNTDFYVLKDNGDNLTLLKQDPLTKDEVFVYYPRESINDSIADVKIQIDSFGYGAISYCSSEFSSNICNYENSVVKYVIDEWIKDKFDEGDLVNDDKGYKGRILTTEETADIFYLNYSVSSLTPKWFHKYTYWTMNDNHYFYVVKYIGMQDKVVGSVNYNEQYAIRPIVNVKENSVKYVNPENKAAKEYDKLYKTNYKIGDVINYNNTKFYVLRDSDSSSDTVTLLKAEPLTISEVEKYGNGHINIGKIYMEGVVSDIEGYGGVAYYSNSNCSNSFPPYNTECTPLYSKSSIKYIVDAWGDDLFDSSDVVIEKENKYRILNKEDVTTYLKYINYKGETTVNAEYLNKSDNSPNFNLVGCWVDYVVDDSQMRVLMKGTDENFYMQFVFDDRGTICPVVTLKKNVDINNDKSNTTIVDVPDTKMNSVVIKVVCGVTILVIGVIVYIYLKKKQGKSK